MLRGTGSNIYSANLAAALARLGHEVHLVCQDRRVRIDGVEIHNPDIHGLLPVYVKDPYEGFEVKAFPELTEEELDRYLDDNVEAVREVVAGAGPLDAALAGHLVMGPCILARAGIGGFAAKIHGSALEYTVKPNPRFLPYAEEGMRAASGVLTGSHHTAVSLWEALPDVAGLREKTRLGPPGVDTEQFRPAGRTRARAAGRVRRQADGLQGNRSPAGGLAAGPRPPSPRRGSGSPGSAPTRAGSTPARARSTAATSTMPARSQARPRPRRRAEEPLPILSAFLAAPPPGYLEAARGMAASVELVGRLEHDEVAAMLPDAEALVMPSTFPEAFGMVAAEAAACGALPVSAGHSGMLEVSRQLAASLPPEAGDLTSFAVEEGAVEAIAERLNRWLGLPAERGRRPARRSSRPPIGSGAGRAWPAASWPPHGGRWTVCRMHRMRPSR